MSDPLPPSPSTPLILSVRDRLINGARNENQLILSSELHDPVLHRRLVGKPLITAKSPPVVVIVMLITGILTKYGLSMDDETVGALTTVITAIVAYGMRYITDTPINSV